MRQIVCTSLLLFCFGAYALAQYPPATEAQDQSKKDAGTYEKTKSISGCLRTPVTASDTFVVKNKNTNQWTEVVPSPEVKTEFASHVGHNVRLVGEWVTETAMANPGETLPQSSEPGKGGKTVKQFKVSRIEMISETCAKQDLDETPILPKR